MEDEVEFMFDEAKEHMEKTISHLKDELLKIRAGKASVNMLDSVMVDYYGTMTPLARVANMGTPDARTIGIQPWEKNMIAPIERAIMNSDLGLNPSNNGEKIIVNIPILTEERRKILVKQSHTEGENAKISIRNKRREINDELKKFVKDGLSEDVQKDREDEIQKYTDDYSKKVDELINEKENDIMTV